MDIGEKQISVQNLKKKMFLVMRAITNRKGSSLGGYNFPVTGRTEVRVRHVVAGDDLKSPESGGS